MTVEVKGLSCGGSLLVGRIFMSPGRVNMSPAHFCQCHGGMKHFLLHSNCISPPNPTSRPGHRVEARRERAPVHQDSQRGWASAPGPHRKSDAGALAPPGESMSSRLCFQQMLVFPVMFV